VGLSTMARQDFITEVALHFDLNRKSQLVVDGSLATCGPRALVNDLGLRLDLLTRIDLVFELPASADSASRSAVAMLTGATIHVADHAERIRSLQVMVALLRERHPQVDLVRVAKLMQQRLDALLKPLKKCETPNFDPSAFSRRMANSLRKLVAASARVCDRGIACDQDVELAAELLQPKTDFLRGLATGVPDLRDSGARQSAIERFFAGRVFAPRDVMNTLGIPRRTAMRDLAKVAKKVGRGKYQIPNA
jgi:hypothetical protein